jgi:hypothetical protein
MFLEFNNPTQSYALVLFIIGLLLMMGNPLYFFGPQMSEFTWRFFSNASTLPCVRSTRGRPQNANRAPLGPAMGPWAHNGAHHGLIVGPIMGPMTDETPRTKF